MGGLSGCNFRRVVLDLNGMVEYQGKHKVKFNENQENGPKWLKTGAKPQKSIKIIWILKFYDLDTFLGTIFSISKLTHGKPLCMPN